MTSQIQLLNPPIHGYLSGLYEYRAGDPIRWIEWFAETTERSANSARDLLATVTHLLGEWRQRLAGAHSDSTVHRVIELLPRQSVVSAGLVAKEGDVSRGTGLTALEALE